MSASTLLVLFVGLALIFVLRMRRRLALLAEQIRQLRAQALEPVSYAPAPASNEHDDRVAKITAEAEGLGFTRLGDYVEDSTAAVAGLSMRWFVDAAGTTFGWIAPFDVGGQKHMVAVLMSHELGAQTITARQPPASLLARPPFVSMHTLPLSTSLTETYTRHKKFAGIDDDDRAFIPVRTFDQLVAELGRMRSKTIEWRRSQAADELLDADLKSLLGAQYSKLVGPLRRRLGGSP